MFKDFKVSVSYPLYQTRGGDKVRVYAVDAGGEFPVHGATFECGGEWVVRTWRLSGLYNSMRLSDKDIVGMWGVPPNVDWSLFPKHIVAVAMDESLRWYAYTYIPIRCAEVWDNPPTLDRTFHLSQPLAGDLLIPTYSGDWKDSLCIRPEIVE